jgi:RNA polymerase sigma factor (sigma-70 family)
MEDVILNDNAILALILDPGRQDEGYRKLIRKYKERLYWHIRRMVVDHDDADDVLQNVFVKIFKNVQGFQGQSELFTWIYRIATNECLTFIERNKRRNLVVVNDISNVGDSLVQQNSVDGQQALSLLKAAITLLPEKQRLVFNMRYYDEMSYQEIADITETSVGALKATYHHAVKKIESYVLDKMD